ncbi:MULTISPECIES: hypothetical protein [Deinococcus]|uniref:Uncharacterized protein n=1 Tax=Deinococcus rufus TaxID=2136097 RepID=A0ABV7Z9B7_9DEIO|nr:hypothetical protein [Deinococcus sp. AB2017081]WQE97185.1 hypothetical protein U2P90_19125 [Deinococcus sp. AB2017081]
MSSIKNMMKQAQPDDGRPGEAGKPPIPSVASGGGESRRALNLPVYAAPEERKPLSTRVKPSLKKVLEAYVQECRDAGFPVTQELVLDALLRELRDDHVLRERVARVLIRELT